VSPVDQQTFFETKQCANTLPEFDRSSGAASGPVNTSCFADTMDQIIDGSPSGKEQFFTIPNVRLRNHRRQF
jgi:hypothetical protein